MRKPRPPVGVRGSLATVGGGLRKAGWVSASKAYRLDVVVANCGCGIRGA